MKNAKKIPSFNTIDEEREFWDKHNAADYFRDAEVIEREFSKGDKAEIAIIQAVRAVQTALGDAESRSAGEMRQAIRLAVRTSLRRSRSRARTSSAPATPS